MSGFFEMNDEFFNSNTYLRPQFSNGVNPFNQAFSRSEEGYNSLEYEYTQNLDYENLKGQYESELNSYNDNSNTWNEFAPQQNSRKRVAPFTADDNDTFASAVTGMKVNSKSFGSESTAMRAQNSLQSLNSTVDGFYSADVNISSIPFGVDDSELGLNSPFFNADSERPKSTGKFASDANCYKYLKTDVSPQCVVPEISNTVNPVVREKESAVLACDQVENTSNESTTILESDSELVRRAKRRLTDKQRRAKIKGGLDQLRSIVTQRGNTVCDHASIVASSVELVENLVAEKQNLTNELARIESSRFMLAQSQMLQSQAYDESNKVSDSGILSNLLHHLSAYKQQNTASQPLQLQSPPKSILSSPVAMFRNIDQSLQASPLSSTHNINCQAPESLAPAPAPPQAAASSAIAQLIQADPSLAESLDHIILSSYFLQTLQLLSNTSK